MNKFPKKLKLKLNKRSASDALRQLASHEDLIDFSSNDYLGFAQNQSIFNKAHKLLVEQGLEQNSSTGSRLLTGNHKLYMSVENLLCNIHQSDAALVFNSGYDANLGLFSSVLQKGDVILYDEFIHASIRDGIAMSLAKAYKFKHNNIESLDKTLKRIQRDNEVYVVTESVFSMDGDSPDLTELSDFCTVNRCHLVVDEAHALGVYGAKCEGLIQQLGLQDKMFARVVTFGKGLGVHGAAVLGSNQLKQYLVNFSRPFIYTTALPPHALASIKCAYEELSSTTRTDALKYNINYFKEAIIRHGLQSHFINSNSAIQSCIIPGNKIVKTMSNTLAENGFDVKPILSPTVPAGQERLRFCLHSYNSSEEIERVVSLLHNSIDSVKP